MKTILKSAVLCSLLHLLCSTAICWSATYYVDATNGNDSNPGTSESTAWKTIAKVNSSKFNPGAFILFKRGEVWREQLNVPSSGLPESPITFGAYGGGNKPIIDGENTRDYSILGVDKSYITIEDIVLQNAVYDGLRITTDASNISTWKIYRVVSKSNNRYGINSEYKVGYSYTRTDFIIGDCEVFSNGTTGITVPRNGIDHIIRRNHVYNNNQDDNANDGGIRIIDFDGSVTGLIIEENDVHDNGTTNNGTGIWLDTLSADSIIRYNKVYDNNRDGIFIEMTSSADVYYNIVYGNRLRGIYVNGSGTVAQDNEIYNNVSYNNIYGIMVAGDGSSDMILNNTFKNNISVRNNTANLRVYNGGGNDGVMGSSNIYTYNCFGEEFYGFIRWNFSDKDTYNVWEMAYEESNSVESNPIFIDASNNDYTLQTDSPCIDAGVDVGLTQDFDGNFIIGNLDIGAYEFHGGDIDPPAPPKNLRLKSNY